MRQLIPYIVTLPNGRVVEVNADTEENALAGAALDIGVDGLPFGTTAEPEAVIKAERLLRDVRAVDDRVTSLVEDAKAHGFPNCAARLREANGALIAACVELHPDRPNNDVARAIGADKAAA